MAAELAGLGEEFEVSHIEKEEELKDEILRDLMASASERFGQDAAPESPLDELLQKVEEAAAGLAELNDPNHVYALSNIETD